MDNPDAVAEPNTAAKLSAEWWEKNGFNARTSTELNRAQFDRVTKSVNGPAMLKADARWNNYQQALKVLVGGAH